MARKPTPPDEDIYGEGRVLRTPTDEPDESSIKNREPSFLKVAAHVGDRFGAWHPAYKIVVAVLLAIPSGWLAIAASETGVSNWSVIGIFCGSAFLLTYLLYVFAITRHYNSFWSWYDFWEVLLPPAVFLGFLIARPFLP